MWRSSTALHDSRRVYKTKDVYRSWHTAFQRVRTSDIPCRGKSSIQEEYGSWCSMYTLRVRNPISLHISVFQKNTGSFGVILGPWHKLFHTVMAPVVPVAEEHRRLFGYRPLKNSRASSSTSSRNRKQPAPKRRVVATSTRDRISIPIRNTRTRTFVCLQKIRNQCPFNFWEGINGSGRVRREKQILFQRR